MILESPQAAAPFYARRRTKLLERLAEEPVDALLVTELANVRYLCGFTGTAGSLFFTHGRVWFLTDFRYVTQANEQVSGVEVREYKESLPAVAGLASEQGVKRLGFEAEHLSAAHVENMKKKLGGVALTPTTKLVETIRLTKDEPEIEAIRGLLAMQERLWPEVKELIRPGAIERDVAVELEYRLRKLGADAPAFDFIVASGERSALPHGVASSKTIRDGEMVILDWGAKAWGYHSDNTRTFAVGDVGEKMKQVYRIVLEANRAAIEFVRTGVTMKQVDEVARTIIGEAGYAGAFGHGTGHGVGLMIHEDPTVSWRSDMVVETGMVFTIEPGIYLPGAGGVRIEDMVRVTGGGCEVLSAGLPKEFTVLGATA